MCHKIIIHFQHYVTSWFLLLTINTKDSLAFLSLLTMPQVLHFQKLTYNSFMLTHHTNRHCMFQCIL